MVFIGVFVTLSVSSAWVGVRDDAIFLLIAAAHAAFATGAWAVSFRPYIALFEDEIVVQNPLTRVAVPLQSVVLVESDFSGTVIQL